MFNYPNYNPAQNSFYQNNMAQAVQPMVSQMMQQGQPQQQMFQPNNMMNPNAMQQQQQAQNGNMQQQAPLMSGAMGMGAAQQQYAQQAQQQMIVRSVTGIEEAKAAIIDPISTNMFPDFSHNSIYVKKINNNGMPEFYTFALQMEEEKPDPFVAINERLDRIESAVLSSYSYNEKEDGLNVSTNSGDAGNTTNVGGTANAGDSTNVGNDGNAKSGTGTEKSNGNVAKK